MIPMPVGAGFNPPLRRLQDRRPLLSTPNSIGAFVCGRWVSQTGIAREESTMKLPRRHVLALSAAAALSATRRVAWAQTYPTRPLKWIVGFPPGGGADTVARIMGAW